MEPIILVVDDDSANLMLAKKILGKTYRIAAANSGETAFRYLERNRPDLILLDINMPQMNGFEAIKRLKGNEAYRSIPVIFLTADKSTETEKQCFQAGAVDFVGKPFVPDILISRVKRTLELEQYHTRLEAMVAEQAEIITSRTRRIAEIQESVIAGMANLIECRDDSTGKHVKNTQMYVRLITEELQRRNLFPEVIDEDYVQNISKAAPLHDVGKIKVPDQILRKPGKLTEEEYEVMKKHTEYSPEIIQRIIGDIEEEEYVNIAGEIAMYHHERWDGLGYPKGLAGEEIPLSARIMALADVFDALYEERCYKPPVPLDQVMSIVAEGKGTQFDPVIAEVFLSMRPILEKALNKGKKQEDRKER